MLSVVEQCAALIQEHKGIDVRVMDIRATCSWADFFVLATVTSAAHLRGIEKHIMEFCSEQGLEPVRSKKRTGIKGFSTSDEWVIIDLGTVVIHLMTAQSRSFYDLERLWAFSGESDTVPLI
jgi:ribosome-associated protein